MCTVSSILYLPEGSRQRALRVVCSRDEARTRPPAGPPRVWRVGRRRAVWPVDPQGGGTWVAANDAGLVMALLNLNPSDGTPRSARQASRGLIIPALMHHSWLPPALAEACSMACDVYGPFRLLMWADDGFGEVVWDGVKLRLAAGVLPREPLMRTSSGLGDARVAGVREELFRRLVDPEQPTPAEQDRFHAHQWRNRPELSVRMSRGDAETVSVTTVQLVGGRAVRMTYVPLASDTTSTVIAGGGSAA